MNWYFKDGRGSWHFVRFKPQGAFVTMPRKIGQKKLRYKAVQVVSEKDARILAHHHFAVIEDDIIQDFLAGLRDRSKRFLK